jgi:2-polyprenyl-3-methyl-5-hydroxy-6-metoxy-1,4-benzoquinol methylase
LDPLASGQRNKGLIAFANARVASGVAAANGARQFEWRPIVEYDEKAQVTAATKERQRGNRSWWTDQTMSYDFTVPIAKERFSPSWFDEIDQRFIHGARLFIDRDRPFAEMMQLDTLQGKRVLEIGCGMGFHAELLARAGAELTTIDISPTSIEATQRRFQLKGPEGDIRQMDAEALEFDDGTFDAVWSWGVIHHSSRTAMILREIRRVLKPGGRAGIAVYSLDSMTAYVALMRSYVLGFWRGRQFDEVLWQHSDGYSARYYTKDQWSDMARLYFEVEDLRLCGQDVDVVPLPRQLRPTVLKMISEKRQRELAARRGLMLFSRLRAV